MASGSDIVLINKLPLHSQPYLVVVVGSGGWKDTEWERQNDTSFSTVGLKGRAHLWPLLPVGLLPAAWAPTLYSDHRNSFCKFPQAKPTLGTDLDSVLLVGEQPCLLRFLGHL